MKNIFKIAPPGFEPGSHPIYQVSSILMKSCLANSLDQRDGFLTTEIWGFKEKRESLFIRVLYV